MKQTALCASSLFYNDLSLNWTSRSGYLQRLVEPAVSTVAPAASSMQHLDGGRAAVKLTGRLGRDSIQTQREDAPLDRRDRIFVGLIWTRRTEESDIKMFWMFLHELSLLLTFVQ